MPRMLQPSPLEVVHGDPLAILGECATREQLVQFGAWLMSLEAKSAPPDLHTGHHHAESLYGRSVVLQPNTFLAGLPHKHGALNVCVGDITVWTEGKPRQRLTGAHILASEPGCVRVGFAHAPTTWLTVHANLTGSLDPRVIEHALVEHAELLLDRRQEMLQ